MNKLLAVSVAALAAVGLIACSESPMESYVPQFELQDESLRVAGTSVNAWVYGSFVIEVGGTGEPEPILVEDNEPGNFPGHPKNAGLCVGGTWYNPKGQPTGGNRSTPHPHCIAGYTAGGESVEVVLEPISAIFDQSGQNKTIRLTNQSGDNGRIQMSGPNENLNAAGSITAYAVLASDFTQRVGTITINLAQYADADSQTMDCDVDEVFDGITQTGCVKFLIDFSYAPLAVGGQGNADDFEEAGFLWWVSKPLGTTYNY